MAISSLETAVGFWVYDVEAFKWIGGLGGGERDYAHVRLD